LLVNAIEVEEVERTHGGMLHAVVEGKEILDD